MWLLAVETFSQVDVGLTGKETPLPAVSLRWPALDQAKSPDGVPPAE